MEQLIYGIFNPTTGKIIFTHPSKEKCEEKLKTMSNKDELKIGYKWRKI